MWKINKKQFNKWLEHLYAETLPKGIGMLQVEKGYCCLGVACKVLIPINKQDMAGDRLHGAGLGDQDYAPEWLKNINGDFNHRTKKSLIEMNDTLGFSHSEIAMVLDLVYNYNILD